MPSSSNALARELSPYLRQHAHNPVAWLPWGDAAFAAARAEDKPVLLSIGYASCHWCHVMAHESFEDPQIAALMNDAFVNVKVDREERPDVDAIYMRAVQAMTGSGGWPLTVVLTPEGKPFYGGTYFPPHERHGLPSFRLVLSALAAAWRERRAEVLASAEEISTHLARAEGSFAGPAVAVRLAAAPRHDGAETDELIAGALTQLLAAEDPTHGGFGAVPKFPPHASLRFLLSLPQAQALALADRTLAAMAQGGIHDHLGGGFFRYSVDRAWQVPHFEKMLYDNAQLLGAFARAYARTGRQSHRQAARGIVTWLERELSVTAAAGSAAFFSSLDADSDGEEGKFYAWSQAEFLAAAGADAEMARRHYGVGEVGAFEGANVLRVASPEAAQDAAGQPAAWLERANRKLFEARARRPRPATDDKVLSSWNGLVMAALAEAGTAIGSPAWLELGLRNASFLRENLWQGGRLLHLWRAGETKVEGLLEDYAYLGLGLLALYRATFEPWLLAWAFELADAVTDRFADAEAGGYFSTAADAQRLLLRPKSYIDSATPSENAAAAELVWWCARYRSDGELEARALAAVQGLGAAARRSPEAFGSSLRLLHLANRPPRELVIVGSSDSAAVAAMIAAWRRAEDTAAVVLRLSGPADELARLPLAQGRLGAGSAERATAYLCRGGSCRLPANSAAELALQLQEDQSAP